MATKLYKCQFWSQNKLQGSDGTWGDGDKGMYWEIDIYSETIVAGTIEFRCLDYGFKYKMDGSDDPLISAIKTTSVEFHVILDDTSGIAALEDQIQAVATGNEGDLSVRIKYYDFDQSEWVMYWLGPILGDLGAIQDVGINRVLKVRATDGLSQLKFRKWSADGGNAGMKSMLYIIKKCLREIPTTSAYFGTSDFFIYSIPHMYNKAMGIVSGGGSDGVRGLLNDPLNRIYVNSEAFRDQDGIYLSYYHILEQILTAMNLRISMGPWRYAYGYSPGGSDTSRDTWRCSWMIMSPYQYMNLTTSTSSTNAINENTDGFLHPNDLTTGQAIKWYSQALLNLRVFQPGHRVSGSLTKFIAPLYQYSTVYEHSIWQNQIMGPINISTDEWTEINEAAATNTSYRVQNESVDIVCTSEDGNSAPQGWAGFCYGADQKIVISGACEIFPIQVLWDYWGENWSSLSFTGGNVGWIEDGYVMPRMQFNAEMHGEVYDSFDEENVNLNSNYWWHSQVFASMQGSVDWESINDTSCYPSCSAGGGIDWGQSGTANFWPGTQWDSTTPGSYSSYWWNEWTWGAGMTDQFGWVRTEDNEEDWNDLTWWGNFYPVRQKCDIVMQYPSTWNLSAFRQAMVDQGVVPTTYSLWLESAWLPFAVSQSYYKPNMMKLVDTQITLIAKRDRLKDYPTMSDDHYACSAEYLINREPELSDRHAPFGFSYTNLRVYVMNLGGKSTYFNYTVGQYTNTNGYATDGEVLEPDIIIGDQPTQNPNSDVEPPAGVTFTYMGQLMIQPWDHTDDEPFDLSDDSQQWKASDSFFNENWKYMHEIRALNGLSRRSVIKKKLQLKIIDRTQRYDIGTGNATGEYFKLTRVGFNGFLRWVLETASGTAGVDFDDVMPEWRKNAFDVECGYVITGGTFTAGTGQWDITAVDATSMKTAGLDNTTYSGDEIQN